MGTKFYAFFTVWVAMVACAVASTVILEGFDDGDSALGSDPKDLAWYRANTSTSTLSVWKDASTGFPADDYILTYLASASNVPVAGSRQEDYVLAKTGDSLSLSLQFRTQAGDASPAFVVGLSSRTVGTGDHNFITTDGSAGFSDHGGYAVRVSTGTDAAGYRIYRDGGVAGSGLFAGSDFTSLSLLSQSALSTYTIYNLQLTLTRVENGVQIDYTISDTSDTTLVSMSYTDTTSPIYSFDGIAVNSFDSALNLRFDNFQVNYVPEPLTQGILGLSGLILIVKRRLKCLA